MNAAEQKAHRTVTRDLGDRLDAIEPVVEAIEARVSGIFADFDTRLHEERTHRLQLAREQRDYVDGEDRKLRTCCQERWDSTNQTTKRLADGLAMFRAMTFWQRVRWLVTGRVTN